MKKKYIWLFEILFWLIVLSGCFYFFIFNTTYKENAGNTYYLFFDDVKGLVKGSPVRLMGINIGYVRNVKIFDNKVFISFLVTKDGVKIPSSATASIEFYGLGGSTSLELNPKTSDNSLDTEEIIPSKSYRVQDFWNGQALVADVMINIYGAIGRTIKSTGLIDKKEYLKQSALINKFAQQTGQINEAQTVLIYKMSEDTLNYLPKLPDDIDQTDEVKENE